VTLPKLGDTIFFSENMTLKFLQKMIDLKNDLKTADKYTNKIVILGIFIKLKNDKAEINL